MRVLNVISCLGHGRGGHFYSCRAIAEAYHALNSRGDTVDLCTIGWETSPVLRASHLNQVLIKLKKKNIIEALSAFLLFIKKGDYDVLHAYDETFAFPFVRIIAALLNKRYLLTKCGGPNPRWYPFSPTLIVFSQENLDCLRAQEKFRKTQFHLIPNRAIEREESLIDVRKCREELGLNNNYILLRIARIGPKYFESSKQLIEHFLPLAQGQPQLKLLLIGVIESKTHYEELTKLASRVNGRLGAERIIIATNDKYTVEASRFIDLADAVVATGRGVLEAMAKSKPVFIVANDGTIVLICQETAANLAYCNLSGRLPDPPVDALTKHTLEIELPLLLHEPEYQQRVSTFSRDYFENNYSLKNAIRIYESLYHGLPRTGFRIKRPLDFFYSLYWVKKRLATRNA